MKKLLVALCLTCVLAVDANAAEKGKHPALTDEQKAARKELLEKYDANKDGKLDKDEMAKISAEERAKAGYPAGGKGKKAK